MPQSVSAPLFASSVNAVAQASTDDNQRSSTPSTAVETEQSVAGFAPQTVLLSNKALRTIFLLLAAIVAASAVSDWLFHPNDDYHRVTPGRFLACASVLVCAVLCHLGRVRSAFVLFSIAQMLGVANAVLVGGFGIFSPALLLALTPVVLGFAVFGHPRAWRWISPTIAVWLLIVGLDAVGSSLIPSVTQFPSPSAWITSQVMLAVLVISVIVQYARQSARLLTHEQQRHQETTRLLEMREAFNSEREQFMGYLSHELRTPLAAMRAAAMLASHPNASTAVRDRSLATLGSAIGNLHALLDDALDSFAYAQGAFTLNPAPFVMVDFLKEIETLFSEMAKQRGLDFNVLVSVSDESRWVGDRLRLNQMLSNLISNAIKYTPGGRISVRAICSNQAEGLWRFEVEDTGPGISVDNQQRLFQPFSRVAGKVVQDASVKGTGLGLSIVAQLAELMGGRAGCSSKLGAGSVFFVEVCLKPLE